MNLTIKQKIIAVILVVGGILIAIFQRGFSSKPVDSGIPGSAKIINEQGVRVIKTSPEILEDAVLTPNQTVELTFNKPLVNTAEIKMVVEPKIDLKIELSADKKTVKFSPSKGFELGQGYTLKITSETKFEDKTHPDGDLIYHFKTISYNGV